jgi:hypothetical protein
MPCGLYRENYFDLNVRHFHEELREPARYLSTRTVVAAVREEVEKQGLFCALYATGSSTSYASPV